MKLRPHTYKAWWDLHAWAGVLVSLIAYVMFFFGTITLFHAEIAVWQEPRGPVPTNDEVDRIIDVGIARQEIAPASMRVNFPRPHTPGFSMSYSDAKGERHSVLIERGGLVEPRSNVADFLYGLHYLQFPSAPPWLYTIAGLASGLLLLVLVSGVLIHLRELVKHFHQFRPKKRLQVTWSDSHKVLGTIGLPFAAVYAFTGAWMGLDSFVTRQLAEVGFRGDEQALARALRGPADPTLEPVQESASRLTLAQLRSLAEKAERLPGSKPKLAGDCRSVYLNHVGDREATALFYCGDESIVLRQRDGSRVLGAPPEPPTLTRRISEVPYAMHFVEFAKLPLRVLYALLGVAGAAAILTGNWLWLARRVPSWGTWVLQRLTLAVGAGPLAAVALLLVANRFAVSASVERQVFWWGWLAVCAVSVLGKDARVHWRSLIGLAGLGALLVPVVGLVMRDRTYGAWRDVATERAVDGVLFALGVALLSLARSMQAWCQQRTSLTPAVADSLESVHVA